MYKYTKDYSGEDNVDFEEKDAQISVLITVCENNKRIAKNTMMLYFRMLLTMGVGLYLTNLLRL